MLLSDGEREVYSVAEIPKCEAGFLSEAISFEHGPLFDQLLVDMATLASNSVTQSAPKQAELRLLRVPALQVVAAWLHWDGSTPADWLLPTEPTPPCLTAQRLYDGNSFLEVLRHPAQQQLAASNKR
ncbi:hypothetical protein GCM10023185_33130 [Hymenobacter saemangeumensis]|uniref:Uncharacterized protein n=1 Tax=Hymenobacter saemangeumensis TaxID=1084522 RepID=A0ABP8IN50_9BACT